MANNAPKIRQIYTKLENIKNATNEALNEKGIEPIDRLNEIPEVIGNLTPEKEVDQFGEWFRKKLSKGKYELIDEQGEIERLTSYSFYGDQLLNYVKMTHAFQGTDIQLSVFENSKVRTAEFPNLIKFGKKMFCKCVQLTKVSADKATLGEDSVFEGCKFLKEIYLPSLENIYSSFFKDCSSLQSIIIPKASVFVQTKNSFDGCTSLTYLKMALKRGDSEIGQDIFSTILSDNSSPQVILDYSDAEGIDRSYVTNSKFESIKRIVLKNQTEVDNFGQVIRTGSQLTEKEKEKIIGKLCTKEWYNNTKQANEPALFEEVAE